MRAEAFFPSGVLRKIPPSLLSPERVVDTPEETEEFPDFPVCNREEHRGSHHNSRRALVLPLHLEWRVCFLASLGMESGGSHCTSRGGGLLLTLKWNSRCHATVSKDPGYPSALQIHLTAMHLLDAHPEDQLKTAW